MLRGIVATFLGPPWVGIVGPYATGTSQGHYSSRLRIAAKTKATKNPAAYKIAAIQSTTLLKRLALSQAIELSGGQV